jgi:hypothetical protein
MSVIDCRFFDVKTSNIMSQLPKPDPLRSCPLCKVAMQTIKSETSLTHRCENCGTVVTIATTSRGDETQSRRT